MAEPLPTDVVTSKQKYVTLKRIAEENLEDQQIIDSHDQDIANYRGLIEESNYKQEQVRKRMKTRDKKVAEMFSSPPREKHDSGVLVKEESPEAVGVRSRGRAYGRVRTRTSAKAPVLSGTTLVPSSPIRGPLYQDELPHQAEAMTAATRKHRLPILVPNDNATPRPSMLPLSAPTQLSMLQNGYPNLRDSRWLSMAKAAADRRVGIEHHGPKEQKIGYTYRYVIYARCQGINGWADMEDHLIGTTSREREASSMVNEVLNTLSADAKRVQVRDKPATDSFVARKTRLFDGKQVKAWMEGKMMSDSSVNLNFWDP